MAAVIPKLGATPDTAAKRKRVFVLTDESVARLTMGRWSGPCRADNDPRCWAPAFQRAIEILFQPRAHILDWLWGRCRSQRILVRVRCGRPMRAGVYCRYESASLNEKRDGLVQGARRIAVTGRQFGRRRTAVNTARAAINEIRRLPYQPRFCE